MLIPAIAASTQGEAALVQRAIAQPSARLTAAVIATQTRRSRAAEQIHLHFAGGLFRPDPVPPAIELHHEEEDLQQHVAVQPLVEEDEEVERDHGEAERVVPDAAQDEQAYVQQAEPRRHPLPDLHAAEARGAAHFRKRDQAARRALLLEAQA